MFPIESETFVLFDGAYWWMDDLFQWKGRSFGHLMRSQTEDTPEVFRYAELTSNSLQSVDPSEILQIARVYRARFIKKVYEYGDIGIPVVGERLENRVRQRQEFGIE